MGLFWAMYRPLYIRVNRPLKGYRGIFCLDSKRPTFRKPKLVLVKEYLRTIDRTPPFKRRRDCRMVR